MNSKKNVRTKLIATEMKKRIEGTPLLLIRDGRLIRRNLKRLLMSPEELMARLRRHGIHTLSSVSMCLLNNDGEVSIFRTV